MFGPFKLPDPPVELRFRILDRARGISRDQRIPRSVSPAPLERWFAAILAPAMALVVTLIAMLLAPSPRAPLETRPSEGRASPPLGIRPEGFPASSVTLGVVPDRLQSGGPRTEEPPPASTQGFAADMIRVTLSSQRLENKTFFGITLCVEGKGKALQRGGVGVFAGQWATVMLGDFKAASLFCTKELGFGRAVDIDPEPRPQEFRIANSASMVTLNAEEPHEGRSKVLLRYYRIENLALVGSFKKELTIPLGEETAVPLK